MIFPKKQRISFSFSSLVNIKKKANKIEKKIAKEINLKQTPASGSTKFIKGDYFSKVMLDLKSTDKDQFIIKTSDLRVAEQNAILSGKAPVLLINFNKSNKVNNKKWVLVPLAHFEVKE